MACCCFVFSWFSVKLTFFYIFLFQFLLGTHFKTLCLLGQNSPMKTSGNFSWPLGLHLHLHRPLNHVTMSEFWGLPACLLFPSYGKSTELDVLGTGRLVSFWRLILVVSHWRLKLQRRLGCSRVSECVPQTTWTTRAAAVLQCAKVHSSPMHSDTGEDIGNV